MTTTTTITGHEAIKYATQHGLTLSKYADPVEDARDGLTVEEAAEIAAEDPSLVWIEGHPALGAAATYLATPAGGWGETQQAYARLRDECDGVRDVDAAIDAAIDSGCYVHPSRRVQA